MGKKKESALMDIKMERFERRILFCALIKHNNNITQTARFLGRNRTHIYRRMKELHIPMELIRTLHPSPQAHRGNSLWQELGRLDKAA